ncbi:MAG TPA: shikimate kinase [Ignavibacteriaceae bacterium]|nr:shikimate kinase [Ignavibacteriaceae bacterium]
MRDSIIYLAGFMGAGKSTIGPILANTIGWNFYDLDKEIEKERGKKVREIFEQDGEDSFRKTERDVLENLIKEPKIIISLGGGTLANEDNFNLIKKTGKIFYLKASPEAIYRRLRYKRDRPALFIDGDFPAGKERLAELIKKLLNDREKFYLLSDYIILTDNIPVGKTVDKIAKIISSK